MDHQVTHADAREQERDRAPERAKGSPSISKPLERASRPNRKKVNDPDMLMAVKHAHAVYGRNVKQITRVTGVKPSTLKRWYREGYVVGDRSLEVMRDSGVEEPLHIDSNSLRDDTWSVASESLKRVKEKLPTASARDAADIFAKTFDRGRLLDGEATERVDVRVSADVRLLQQYGLIPERGEVIEAEVIENPTA